MAKTFAQFKEDVQALVFPDGLPENLIKPFEFDCIVALTHVSRWVPYFQSRNRDEFPFCATLFSCGATVIPAIVGGTIQRIYTLQGDCCPVFYSHIPDFDEFQNWLIANRRRWTEPSMEGKPALPDGFKYADAITDKGKRYNFGRYSINNDRIYIGHRIESTESLIVEWRGIRKRYRDSDLMPYDDPDEGDERDPGVELTNAVASFVRSEFWRKYDRSKDWIAERSIWNDMVADMKHDEWAQNTPKSQPVIPENDQLIVSGSCAATECDTEPLEENTDVFAVIGDWGKLDNPSTESPACVDVEAVVQEWEPSFIVTTGDNRYGAYSFDDLFAVCEYYKGFKDRGLFFPGIGNHDTDDDDGINGFLNAFPYLPGDRRNFDIQLGHVHFFFRETHDAGSNPVSAASLAQSAARLRQRLSISRAPWKVVITQDPPFCSDASGSNYPGHAASQLDYESWGADLVISGDSHYYEKIIRDGFPYLICGLSGANKNNFNVTPVEGSEVRYNTLYGALKGTATCDELKFEFINTAGVVVDTLTLTKEDA